LRKKEGNNMRCRRKRRESKTKREKKNPSVTDVNEAGRTIANTVPEGEGADGGGPRRR